MSGSECSMVQLVYRYDIIYQACTFCCGSSEVLQHYSYKTKTMLQGKYKRGELPVLFTVTVGTNHVKRGLYSTCTVDLWQCKQSSPLG